MLNEDMRLVRPDQIKDQVDWANLEGVVILGLKKEGETNVLHMSSITVAELALLTKQLESHLVHVLGAMDEQ